jgi:hypothetical protein
LESNVNVWSLSLPSYLSWPIDSSEPSLFCSARLLRLFVFEPSFELVGGHVDVVVEVTAHWFYSV